MSHFPRFDPRPPPDDLLHVAVELRALMALEGLLLLELLGGNPAAHDVLEGVVILHRDLEHRHEQLERMLAKKARTFTRLRERFPSHFPFVTHNPPRTSQDDVLIGNEARKTGWMRAEAAGDPGPWRQQALLGRGHWDADALRDVVRDYVIEHLGTDDGVLVIDETGFLKKGQASCGVGRQYTGSAGKITNCQIGVFATYVSARGHALIDRALYLPKDWTSDRERLQQAHVPDDVVFATKPALASMMIERSIEAGVPFHWVAADSVYGVGDVERTLRRAGVGYVLGVKGNHWFGSWATSPLIAGEAKDIAANLPKQDWHRLSAGHGTKGERLYDWAYLALADLDAEEFDCPKAGPWTRGLMIRRNIADGDLAYFTTWCPKGTTMQELVNVEGTRWRIEECFETAKNEFGLDHNETRSWHGWHRHVSLVMFAYAVMASVRYQANSRKPKKTQRRTRSSLSAGPYRKSGASS